MPGEAGLARILAALGRKICGKLCRRLRGSLRQSPVFLGAGIWC